MDNFFALFAFTFLIAGASGSIVYVILDKRLRTIIYYAVKQLLRPLYRLFVQVDETSPTIYIDMDEVVSNTSHRNK